MSRLAKVNEFVLRFANVNGTGSASANGLVARALFRMGLPVGPKNIFPSNSPPHPFVSCHCLCARFLNAKRF